MPSLFCSFCFCFRCARSKRNPTHPSGEQCCVCLQLTHEMRSSSSGEEEESADEDASPCFLFFDFADDADGDLVALFPPPSLLPLLPLPSSRYVSATALRYHSSVATTSSRKERARTRCLLSLFVWCCFLCLDEEARGVAAPDVADEDEGREEANASAFSWSGCRLLQPPPAPALLLVPASAAVEGEVLSGRRPPFPPLIFLFGQEEGEEREKSEGNEEQFF